MTEPEPQADPSADEVDTPVEVFDPEAHPHPLRAKDVAALLAQEIG